MDFSALIMACTPANVSSDTMSHIVNVESFKRPNAIGYKIVKNDGSVFRLTAQPKNREEAVAWASWFMENGYHFDAGAAQVNSRNFKKYNLDINTIFSACENIRVGGEILAECYSRALPKYVDPQVSLRAAISCYQSGNFNTGFKTGYVQKVIDSKMRMKK